MDLLAWIAGGAMSLSPLAVLQSGVLVVPGVDADYDVFTALRFVVIGVLYAGLALLILRTLARIALTVKDQSRAKYVSALFASFELPLCFCVATEVLVLSVGASGWVSDRFKPHTDVLSQAIQLQLVPLLLVPLIDYYGAFRAWLYPRVERVVARDQLVPSPSRRFSSGAITWTITLGIYWLIFLILYGTFPIAQSYLAAIFSKVEINFADVDAKDRSDPKVREVSFDLRFKGLIFPTICFVISERTEARKFWDGGGFAPADVVVDDQGKVIAAVRDGNALPCQAIHYFSYERGAGYRVQFRMPVPDSLKDPVAACEVVSSRSRPIKEQGSYKIYVAGSTRCGDGHLLTLR